EPVRMLIDFAIEVGMKVLEFIFEGVLGPTGARVLAIMKKARSTFVKIIKNPMAFVGHLIDALAKGFRQFSSNILTHLKNGLIAWLTGTLSGAGIQLPERFDFKGIVSLVLQILGLTWPRIREKLVRRLGERTVAFLETSFDIIRLLITEGPGALWEKLMEHVSNLKDTVMEGIRNFIITRIVTAAVTKLATMWNPAGAVIQAIIGIYNTVMFFIERINQILDLVESVVNSVSKIAAGMIQDAADFVEQAMARTIPVILGFLARLIGLGNISSAIQNIIRRVQATVDRGLERVLDWIERQGRALYNRLSGRGRGTSDRPRGEQSEREREANKQAALRDVRGRLQRGITLGQLKAYLPQLQRQYQLSEVRLDRDLDVKITNSDPAEVPVTISHDIGLDDERRLVERRQEQRGSGSDEITYTDASPSVRLGTINSSSDHPATLKKVLNDALPDDMPLSRLEHNRYFTIMEDAPARPLSVTGTLFNYIPKLIPSSARSGTSQAVSRIGILEQNYPRGDFDNLQGQYDGGHLIAHSFGGPDAYYNLVPMKSDINRVVYRRLERFFERQIRADSVEQIDTNRSNLELEFGISYGSNYQVNMQEFIAQAGRADTRARETARQEAERLGSRQRLARRHAAAPETERQRLAQGWQQLRDERDQLREADELSLRLWNVVRHSRVAGKVSDIARSRTVPTQLRHAGELIPMAQRAVDQINNIAGSGASSQVRRKLSNLQQSIARAESGSAVRSTTETRDVGAAQVQVRLTTIQRLAGEIRTELERFQQARNRLRALELRVAGLPRVPPDGNFQPVIADYERRIREAEATRTDTRVESNISAAEQRANFPPQTVTTRIPTSFSVTATYNASAGHVVRSIGNENREFDSAEFQNIPGQSRTTHGTIDVNTLPDSTPVQIGPDRPAGADGGQSSGGQSTGDQPASEAGAGGSANERRYTTTFTIGQTKLETPRVGDRYEREADRVADHVVRGDHTTVQEMTTNSQVRRSADVENRTSIEPKKSGGRALDAGVRKRMEHGIGTNFSNVRVHTDSDAIQMNRSIHAQAFTHENHIYFNKGKYRPGTDSGDHLLAHELTHTVQQDSIIRRQAADITSTSSSATTTEPEKLTGPPVLGSAPISGLEPPVDGEIKSPAQVEQQAEAEAGIKKEKKEQSLKVRGEGRGGKDKKKTAGEEAKNKTAKEQEAEEQSLPHLEPLKSGSSDGMLSDFMTSPASKIAASYPALGAGISTMLKAEKKQEADSAPKLVARAGKGKMKTRAPSAEARDAQKAVIEEKKPKPVIQQKVAEHKDLTRPVSNARNNKALDQSPAGSWISWFKDRVRSF
ncbi:MAG: DUF4157 domain-containing protein, partial [Deltaproteobacteria bacterium]|nr:DUF4157 domain-containing protein [Deltaproteobacteria bacterium]